MWETKIRSGSEEKGVRKSQGVDVPDEPVSKTYCKQASSSTDSSPVTILKSKSAVKESVDSRSDSNTREIVERKYNI